VRNAVNATNVGCLFVGSVNAAGLRQCNHAVHVGFRLACNGLIQIFVNGRSASRRCRRQYYNNNCRQQRRCSPASQHVPISM
jgi:hypothetical protein